MLVVEDAKLVTRDTLAFFHISLQAYESLGNLRAPREEIREAIVVVDLQIFE